MIYIFGSGHGGPAAAANAHRLGTYTESHQHIRKDTQGMRRLVRPALMGRQS